MDPPVHLALALPVFADVPHNPPAHSDIRPARNGYNHSALGVDQAVVAVEYILAGDLIVAANSAVEAEDGPIAVVVAAVEVD